MSIIEINNLVKMYKNERVLNISAFSFLYGRSYLLLGQNGSGKSTLIKLILGLTKESSGMIKKSFKRASYVPERFIFPDFMTVNQFLMIILSLSGRSDNTGMIEKMCKELDVDMGKELYKLSKGNKQKVLIIQALIQDNDLYVFDEALNGLDQVRQAYLIEHIKELTKKGKTVIIATHFGKYFEEAVDEILEITDGELKIV